MDVVVWGNCQAAPIAALIREPLARAGLRVVDVDPVFLLDDAGVAAVHERMTTTALLVAQPIRDEYRVPGCATDRLASLLPDGATVVRFPVIYHSGYLPFQVTANGADGVRVPAPLTDYHDLRVLVGASEGWSADRIVAAVDEPADPEAVARHAADSLAELRRRETDCDVAASDLVDAADALFTVNHPRNTVLSEVAHRVLAAAGHGDGAGDVPCPEREYLGAIRAPVTTPDPGDQPPDRREWVVGGRPVPWAEVVAAHLQLYRERPDVVVSAVRRHGPRAADLGLLPGRGGGGLRAG